MGGRRKRRGDREGGVGGQKDGYMNKEEVKGTGRERKERKGNGETCSV